MERTSSCSIGWQNVCEKGLTGLRATISWHGLELFYIFEELIANTEGAAVRLKEVVC